jgi:type III restriction enzyme
LFSGGDNDYYDFIKGDYKHIIFNQTLQEGWDDPSCCFAYIDKDMGSITQVTQIIGRVLRQPNVKHYSDERLNMANFYIKTDERDIFKSIVEEIKNTLLMDIPEVNITYRLSDSKSKNLPTIEPRVQKTVPSVAIISDRAKLEIDLEIDKMMDYREDKVNTIGSGQRIRYISSIGEGEELKEVVTITTNSNKVTARWIFKRELDKLAKKAITLCDISNVKFDALVEYNSNAANNIRELASKISRIYREKSIIVQNPLDTIEIGSVVVDNDSRTFKNSIHERYSDLNGFEERFAVELDNLGYDWMRNPQNGYLKIALLDGKGTNNFNPDFIVWSTGKIFAIDTKGNHIIDSEARRKLFYVEKTGEGSDLDIKLISEKRYNNDGQIIDENGYTVWLVKQGKITTETCAILSDAVKLCVN